MAQTKNDTHSPTDSLSAGELLAAAFEATESVRFIVKQDGSILYFNRKAYENGLLLHGKKLEKGHSLFEYAGDAANNVQGALKADLKRTFKGETFRVETEIHYNKTVKWFQTEYIPVFHKLKIIAASISIYDITEAKRLELSRTKAMLDMEAAQQERLQKLEQMLDTIYERSRLVFEKASKTSELQIVKNLKNLCADILALQNKVSGWQKKK